MQKKILVSLFFLFLIASAFAIDITPTDQPGQNPTTLPTTVMVAGMPELQASVSQLRTEMSDMRAAMLTKDDLTAAQNILQGLLDTVENRLISDVVVSICVGIATFFVLLFIFKARKWL